MAETEFQAGASELAAQLDAYVASSDIDAFGPCLAELRQFEVWLGEARGERQRLAQELMGLREQQAALELRLTRQKAEQATLQERTEIFTVDTELDEIMTAFKLTFMNLAVRLIREHLRDPMELDTLIRSILRLPGELRRREGSDTICIYRQPRDSRAMEAVGRACESLTALQLQRGDRRLDFQIVDAPADASGSH